MRHYYALSDSYTGPSPKEHTSGFANTGEAIAFSSAGKRAAWLAATKLLKARAITRPESSPRSWGCFRRSRTRSTNGSVFPTLVGVFLDDMVGPGETWCLPHARGGVSHL